MTDAQAAELWAAIAELRDELLTLDQRVTHVHRQALRALTDALEGKQDDTATRHTTDR